MLDLDTSLNVRRLRGILAERRITHHNFAITCGLSRPFVSRVLSGSSQPGELASIKIHRAIKALGLDRDEGAVRAS